MDSLRLHSNPARSVELPFQARFNGRRVLVRKLESGDLGRVVDFFAAQSADARRRAANASHLGQSYGDHLVNGEDSGGVILGVFAAEQEGTPILAIGSFWAGDDPRKAEVRLIVRAEFRRQGIATMLLRVLAPVARERGIEFLTATMQPEDAAVRAVFARFNATFSAAGADGRVAVTLPLSAFPEYRRSGAGPSAPEHHRAAEFVEHARSRLRDVMIHLPPTYPLP